MTAKPLWIATAAVLVAALTACTERSDQAAPQPLPAHPEENSQATLVAARLGIRAAFEDRVAELRYVGGGESRPAGERLPSRSSDRVS